VTRANRLADRASRAFGLAVVVLDLDGSAVLAVLGRDRQFTRFHRSP
jgi:ligand-binding sensor protein